MISPSLSFKQFRLAIATVLLALLLMLALNPLLRLTQASFLLFFGAVTVSALYGGRGSGIVATLLSALCANYFFLAPQHRWTFDLASSLRLLLFVLQGLLISVLVGSLRSAQEQTRKSLNQLKATEAEIKDLNQTLQQRADELQTLFDVIPISIAIAEDPDCRTIKANPAFTKLLQVPTDANTSCTPFPGESQPPFRFYQNGRELTGDDLPQQYAAKHGVELRDLEIDIIRGDNTVLNLYGYAAPLFDESGKPRGSVGAFVDISERKRVEDEHNRIETALRKLVECSKITGSAFFEALVRILAELFQVRYVYVGEVLPDHPSRVRTIAAWVDGKPGGNIEYELVNTPCEQVVQQKTCFYPRNVATLFPQDQILIEMGIESYMGTPLCAPNGEVVGLLTILHDQPLDESLNPQALLEIFAGKTAAELQRERAIAELRQSEERYRAFVTYSAEGIWRFELEEPLPISIPEDSQIEHLYKHAYLAECNRVMAEMYGFSAMEQIIGARLGDLVPQSDSRNLDYLKAFIRAGYRLQDAESYEVDRFGKAKYFANNLVGIIEDGCLVRAWGNQRDISERKQAEEALRQSEARFRLAAHAVAGIVYDWDVVTGSVFRSEGLYELLGIRAEDAPATREWWAEQMHPDDLARLIVEMPVNLTSSERYDHEYRVRHQDGHWVNVWDRGFFIRDNSGQLVRVVGSTANISDRKRAEQEREQLLAREKAAREEAESANRVKDEFLAVLSHELRSPLNPILGWAKLLQTRQLDEQGTKHALQTIERNAKLQAQLIGDLLDVSRILQGKLALNICPVNLDTVVESALETVRLSAEAKQIQIQVVLSIDPLWVSGDAGRLQQIVWNLLSNAVKFTPNEGKVEVRLTQVDHSAQLQVRDTGKGISPTFLPYVFDYFRQEDGKTTRQFGGLGLGLAIVRHLTELHGGTVYAESPGEGQGATFTIQLPLMTVKQAPEQTISDTPQALDLSQLQILIVDDEADMRELGKVILEQQGAQVTVAASAAEALLVFDRQPPDMLISDIGMPEVDGYMLMRQIRNRSPERGGQVLAIALTAYAGEYNQQQALAAGFQRHISKPLEPEELVEAIVQVVNSSD